MKLLKTAKKIHDYVVKNNNLDEQMEVMQVRVAKLVGAWSTGGNTNTSRGAIGGLGTQTLSLIHI